MMQFIKQRRYGDRSVALFLLAENERRGSWAERNSSSGKTDVRFFAAIHGRVVR